MLYFPRNLSVLKFSDPVLVYAMYDDILDFKPQKVTTIPNHKETKCDSQQKAGVFLFPLS